MAEHGLSDWISSNPQSLRAYLTFFTSLVFSASLVEIELEILALFGKAPM